LQDWTLMDDNAEVDLVDFSEVDGTGRKFRAEIAGLVVDGLAT